MSQASVELRDRRCQRRPALCNQEDWVIDDQTMASHKADGFRSWQRPMSRHSVPRSEYSGDARARPWSIPAALSTSVSGLWMFCV